MLNGTLCAVTFCPSVSSGRTSLEPVATSEGSYTPFEGMIFLAFHLARDFCIAELAAGCGVESAAGCGVESVAGCSVDSAAGGDSIITKFRL